MNDNTTTTIRGCEMEYDLVRHLTRQRSFSFHTFGPGRRTEGILDHLAKELEEVRANPTDLEEWIDIALLAMDGAWRAGHEPDEIARGLLDKLRKNEIRTWPDWRTSDPDKALEHIR